MIIKRYLILAPFAKRNEFQIEMILSRIQNSLQMLRHFLYFLSNLLGPFSTGQNFLFFEKKNSGAYASKDKRNYRSSYKILPSGKQQSLLDASLSSLIGLQAKKVLSHAVSSMALT